MTRFLAVVLGPATIPGSVRINATMDSEDRFYAIMFAAYGVALLFWLHYFCTAASRAWVFMLPLDATIRVPHS